MKREMQEEGSAGSGSGAGSDPDGDGNPLLEEWQGPHGGVPPFDRVRVEHFPSALDLAIRQMLEEVDAIAADPRPPDFENTLAAMERAGRSLDRVRSIGSVWRSTLSTAEFRAFEREMMMKLAELNDRITQNESLFQRVESVHQAGGGAGASPEEARLAWLYYTDFVRHGAALDAAAKGRLAEINQRLAELSTRFDQNVLADERENYLLLDREDDLAGLPAPEIEAAAAEAEARGYRDHWLIANTRSAVEPFLKHAERRDLRERVWRTFVTRGEGEGVRDNQPIIAEILRLRAERAGLLGYSSHAAWALERSMAKVPDRALELMERVWSAAVARVRSELADMREHLRASGEPLEIEPWDYRFLAEKVRKGEANLDWDEVKPYLQLDRLRDAMFWVAGELFGLQFAPVTVPRPHPDVRVWSVTDRADQREIGLFYFDPFAREGKKSGAWMSHYRRQARMDGGTQPIVSNNCNYIEGREGEPVLISWTDAKTLFHEFGHALHGLLSDVTYPSLAGTAVGADYSEFPSQIFEHWLVAPQVLRGFAVHFRTGEPIPEALVERIEQASTLERGFSTTEELASGMVDMCLHLESGPEIDPPRIERETLQRLGMPREMVMRHRLPHFGHIFSSDHYAARYYSYLWADVLTADAYEAFLEGGGLFDRGVAGRLREHVLARGNTVDPEAGYRAFRGRDPRVEPLMRKRGLADP